MATTIGALSDTLPQRGTVMWLGIRHAHDVAMEICDAVMLDQHDGIIGDRYNKRGGDRQVTLIQQEHIVAIASLLHQGPVSPAQLRRNIVVSGINLLALENKHFHVGSALLEYTGLCHPCSHMEAALGPGGYNAMRGHGGIHARVLQSGEVACGDPVCYL